MASASSPEDLLQQLRSTESVITSVELDATTCSIDLFHDILDALAQCSETARENITVLSIQDISVDADAFNKLCDVLGILEQLQQLSLSGTGLSTNSTRKLCKILNKYEHLHSLALTNNRKLGPRGIKILSEGFLSKSDMLTHLDLSANAMGHFGAQALSLPPNLQQLNLQDNGMGHDGVWKLTESLHTIEHLHTLNVSNNLCLADGCIELARHVSRWQNLRHLNVAGNDIGDVGIEVLAKELEGTYVRELYLEYNQITDAGAAHLADALLKMANLQVLNLAKNNLSDTGCSAIARGLVGREDGSESDEESDADEYSCDEKEEDDEGNESPQKGKAVQPKSETSLKVLNLSHNKIGDGGAGVFVELLDDIPSLQILDLTENEISEARTRILDVLLKHRQHDQQRSESEGKPRIPVLMSPTPKKPMQQKAARAVHEIEAGRELKEEFAIEEGLDLVKSLLSKPLSLEWTSADLPHVYFNRLTGNFSPKRILNHSAIGNLYDATNDEVGDVALVVRSLYMHAAGALTEVRANVVAELKHNKHANILQATAQALGPSLYCFLYDLTEFKSLQEILENGDERKTFTWTTRVKVLLDIARALEYTHSGGGANSHRKPSFHGDIKPSNIFVAQDFSIAKLSGSGLSRLIATDRGRFLSGDVVFGSRGYRCPRYERGSCQYDFASDMFSFGIVVAEILTGCLQGTKKNALGMSNDALFDNFYGDSPFEADPMAGVTVRSVLEAIGQLAAACMNPVLSRRPSASTVVQFLAAITVPDDLQANP